MPDPVTGGDTTKQDATTSAAGADTSAGGVVAAPEAPASDPLSFDGGDATIAEAKSAADAVTDQATTDTAAQTAEAKTAGLGDGGEAEKGAEKTDTGVEAEKPLTPAERRKAFIEEMRGVEAPADGKEAETGKPDAGEKPGQPKKGDAKEGEAAAGLPAIPDYDGDAALKLVTEEFGESSDVTKAFKAQNEQIKALTAHAQNIVALQSNADQAFRNLQQHHFLDGMNGEVEGLEGQIGDGRKAQFTQEQLAAREDLIDAARGYRDMMAKRGVKISDKDAVKKVAPVLFEFPAGTKKSAADKMRETVVKRSESRTIKPTRATDEAPADVGSDESWGADDDYTNKVKKELSKEHPELMGA